MSVKRYILIAALTTIISLSVALFYPYGDNVWSVAAMILVLCNFGIVGWPIFLARQAAPKPWIAYPVGFFAVIAPYFVCTTRQHVDQLVDARFDGKITKLYRSRNHQYAAVEIQDATDGLVTIEAVPEETWSSLSPGDDIQKRPLETYLVRGEERFPIVEPSSLHAIRGAQTK